ncbi:MAG: HAD-IIB family hydrolase [Clostridium sp.]|jgi:Cof subfamily protein (haloacid dehalogenase superfamily)|uniref:HAD-IIB family hydrolase n=1 Tax=Clostridium TaxID=1485 RepID=UPI000C08D7AB|nr:MULTISPECIES: HAD-IIB family hydrolase [Clostridium]MBS5305964.1 HAD family phosphatase [Clostridium sp.]MDB1942245.1 HAD-IIB family hydrolase [Clostridium tertium]MDB1943665.1 HAD-IIB family hydrolase [Clostridium tertium]MDB1951631.1 HAD-IIB family hydrolase [Clostridium tertium]MDB1969824.1 HAD-IIB family hydrolase [Clostridium tertium]
MIKLLATDLDGTLIKNDQVTKRDKDAIIKLQKQKELLVVSTGRPYNGVQMLKDEYKIFANYYVLLNGALIVDTLGTKIKQEIIEKDIIKSIINEIKEENVAISVESGFNTYLLTDGDNLPYPKKERVNSIDEIEEELSLISIYSPEKDILEIEEVKNKINKKYEDKIIAYRNDIYIDIVPLGCSKGNGIKYIAKQEFIKDDYIYTIGDSWNDVTMFNITKNSFTFHHVEEELKEHAAYLVDSVADCIEEHIL